MEFREKKRWGFLGLPFTFTTYMVTEELITVEEGFINKRENDCYIYKVQDVELDPDAGGADVRTWYCKVLHRRYDKSGAVSDPYQKCKKYQKLYSGKRLRKRG